MAVKIGNMAKAIMDKLDDYGIEAGLVVDKVSEDVAKQMAEKLQKDAPKLTGDYRLAWTQGVGETKRTKHTRIVYAEKPEHALSHLLEKGHQNRNGGRTEAKVHIAPVEEWGMEELEKELKDKL